MAKYVIFGAAGHLGTTLIQELLAKHERVIAFVMPQDAEAPQIQGVEKIFVGDITNRDALEEFFKEYCDSDTIVLNSVGIVTIASHFNQAVYDVNVTGVKNIVDFCLKYNVKKLVHVSSVHAIKEKPDHELISEPYHFDEKDVVGLYAKTKAEATQYVLDATKKGLDASVVFPSGIAGPNDYGHGHITKLLIDYYNHRLTSIVKGGYDFVDVRDVANGIINCATMGKKGEGYILSNHYFSVKEVIDIFHQVTGHKPIKSVLPLWFAKGTAGLAELYYKILHQTPLYTAYSLYTLGSNSNFSNEKAKKELGYTTRSFKETVTDTLAFLKANKRIKS
ncbi:MAG: NAD-dependent epimerase/dehydratase family protein [Bacilli bacterium]|jgi:dihydroflavonol-4-reductase|nr:NAD-dependent epimerase/dehydratase family protein [Bacilli bacterium]MDD3422555.1 NAD-dependent epimerase/dehydratase family protein [Bacilli bacterium]MDD4065960.1 NAD-dependent epimerase/dehydratase family protein [Bacilli bacterium]